MEVARAPDKPAENKATGAAIYGGRLGRPSGRRTRSGRCWRWRNGRGTSRAGQHTFYEHGGWQHDIQNLPHEIRLHRVRPVVVPKLFDFLSEDRRRAHHVAKKAFATPVSQRQKINWHAAGGPKIVYQTITPFEDDSMTTGQIDDGGPAFPNIWEDNPSQGHELTRPFRGVGDAGIVGGPRKVGQGYEGLPSKRVSARRP